MIKYMESIQGNVPKVLLLGNGINRAFREDDWDSLLRKKATDLIKNHWNDLDALPYSLKAVVATTDHIDRGLREESINMIEQKNSLEKSNLLRKIMAIDFDAILTTNYTYELEKAWNSEFSIKLGKASKYRYKTCRNKSKEETKRLYQYIQVAPDTPPIWHIHGEAAKPDTMILGHYYYGKLFSKIQDYVGETVKRHKISQKKGDEFYPRSWIDYLLFGNVYILGQGLNFSEFDLWWLINCKKRHGYGTINIYIMTKNIKPDFKMLAEAYGIQIVAIDNMTYMQMYETVISDKFRNV